MQQLFRNQVVDNRQERVMGKQLSVQPNRLNKVSLILALIALLVIILLFLGYTTFNDAASGYLTREQALVQIFPHYSGGNNPIEMSNGDFIEKGERKFSVPVQKRYKKDQNANVELIKELKLQLVALNDELLLTALYHQVEREALLQVIAVSKRELTFTEEQYIAMQRLKNSIDKESFRIKQLFSNQVITDTELAKNELKLLSAIQAAQILKLSMTRLSNIINKQQVELSKIERRSKGELLAIKLHISETEQRIKKLRNNQGE